MLFCCDGAVCVACVVVMPIVVVEGLCCCLCGIVCAVVCVVVVSIVVVI